MASVQYYTEDGYNNMKSRLHELKSKGRRDIAEQIAEARDKGDLSENAEYDAAKDAQGLLEMEIAKLSGLLANGRILDETMLDTSRVGLMMTVQFKNVKNGVVMKYTLVPEEEADLKLQKISIKSPFGQGLIGKKVGERAEIKVPAGVVEVEVIEISR
jgi:transcription elongation factor GreA